MVKTKKEEAKNKKRKASIGKKAKATGSAKKVDPNKPIKKKIEYYAMPYAQPMDMDQWPNQKGLYNLKIPTMMFNDYSFWWFQQDSFNAMFHEIAESQVQFDRYQVRVNAIKIVLEKSDSVETNHLPIVAIVSRRDNTGTSVYADHKKLSIYIPQVYTGDIASEPWKATENTEGGLMYPITLRGLYLATPNDKSKFLPHDYTSAAQYLLGGHEEEFKKRVAEERTLPPENRQLEYVHDHVACKVVFYVHRWPRAVVRDSHYFNSPNGDPRFDLALQAPRAYGVNELAQQHGLRMQVSDNTGIHPATTTIPSVQASRQYNPNLSIAPFGAMEVDNPSQYPVAREIINVYIDNEPSRIEEVKERRRILDNVVAVEQAPQVVLQRRNVRTTSDRSEYIRRTRASYHDIESGIRVYDTAPSIIDFVGQDQREYPIPEDGQVEQPRRRRERLPRRSGSVRPGEVVPENQRRIPIHWRYAPTYGRRSSRVRD